MVVSPRPCAKPRHECAPNEDWDAQFSENVKIVPHAPTHGPQKLLLVTQILKKEKMNRLNLFQTLFLLLLPLLLLIQHHLFLLSTGTFLELISSSVLICLNIKLLSSF